MPDKVWTEGEKAVLQEIDAKISKNPHQTMTNRELQQAIRETFEMWRGASANDNLEKHLNTLLNLQLIRARGGYIDK